MIKHLVFFKLKPEADGRSAMDNAKELEARLRNLKNVIPGIVELDCGIDFNRSPAAFDFALHSSFRTNEDLQIYREHPEHVKVKNFVGLVTDERAVVDYEISDGEV